MVEGIDKSLDNSPPLVSVVIPTHNSMRWIDDAIKTVEDQENVSTEIIVVDNESTDGTVDYLKTKYGSIVTLRYSFSVRVSRLIGVHAARGDFIAFLDHDDLWDPSKLELQLSALAKNPELVAVGTQHLRFFHDPAEASPVDWPEINQATLPQIKRSRIPSFHPSSMMIRRGDAIRILLEVIGLQPQDGPMIAEAARMGAIKRIEKPLTLVREHPESHMRKGLLEWSDRRLRTWYILDDPAEKNWISEHQFANEFVSRGVKRNLKTQYLYVRAKSYRDSGENLKYAFFNWRARGRDVGVSTARKLKHALRRDND